jgi:hypothetical protein
VVEERVVQAKVVEVNVVVRVVVVVAVVAVVAVAAAAVAAAAAAEYALSLSLSLPLRFSYCTGRCFLFQTVIFRTLLTLTVKPRGGHHAVVVSIGDALGLRDTLGAVRGSG